MYVYFDEHFDEHSYLRELNSVPWSVIEGFDCPDDAVDSWHKLFMSVVDKHAPMKQKGLNILSNQNG